MPWRYIVLAGLFTLNLLCWMAYRTELPRWLNVPPAPDQNAVTVGALGDPQFAYRALGYMLQNLGDHGGRTQHIDSYNFPDLKNWFFLADHLDQKSDFIPSMAAYYYGATNKTENTAHLVEYLAHAGARPYTQKWRWLAWSATKARRNLKRPDLALQYANILRDTAYPDAPVWARRLGPVYLRSLGQEAKAYTQMMDIYYARFLQTNIKEQIFIHNFLCADGTLFRQHNWACFQTK